MHEERYLEKLQRAADRRHQRGVRSVYRERTSESDDEVLGNIPRGLVKVFDKVRRHIKGSDRKSRTEAFLEWVEENPGEVYAIQERDAEREVRRLGRGQRRMLRTVHSDEVPF